jgi:isochorismate pyruvate lyase
MTVARTCADMGEVRREIDRIDRQLIRLVAERTGYIAEAARIKTCETTVRDEARIEDVVAKVKAEAAAHGLDADLAETVWRALVEASIAHEMKLFVRKQAS